MKLVKEHINFERGLDPKEAMGIGNIKITKYVKILSDFMNDFKADGEWVGVGPWCTMNTDKNEFAYDFSSYGNKKEIDDAFLGFKHLIKTWPMHKHILDKAKLYFTEDPETDNYENDFVIFTWEKKCEYHNEIS